MKRRKNIFSLVFYSTIINLMIFFSSNGFAVSSAPGNTIDDIVNNSIEEFARRGLHPILLLPNNIIDNTSIIHKSIYLDPILVSDTNILNELPKVIFERCISKNNDLCNKLIDDIFYILHSNTIIKISNDFIRDIVIYEVANTLGDSYDYIIKFAFLENNRKIILTYYWEDDASISQFRNRLGFEAINNYNNIMEGKLITKITMNNLLKYIEFYQFLTSNDFGDIVINNIDDYTLICPFLLDCIVNQNVINFIKNILGTNIRPKTIFVHNGESSYYYTKFYSLSFLGRISYREMKINEEGKILSNKTIAINTESIFLSR